MTFMAFFITFHGFSWPVRGDHGLSWLEEDALETARASMAIPITGGSLLLRLGIRQLEL